MAKTKNNGCEIPTKFHNAKFGSAKYPAIFPSAKLSCPAKFATKGAGSVKFCTGCEFSQPLQNFLCFRC